MSSIGRRDFLHRMAGGAIFGLASRCVGFEPRPSAPLNVLLLVGDDLNCNSVGVFGGAAPDITPNIDRLASEGIRFEHAHITVSVCQPSRSVLMTGRYPHRNGAMGFEPISSSVPTLGESLQAAGYHKGILVKAPHIEPIERFYWDYDIRAAALGDGRDPALFYNHAATFFQQARAAGKPFFMMASSMDPHRPFAGSPDELATADPSRTYAPSEVEVPGFLPDIPDVRTEIAQYCSSVRRCDDAIGQVLRALEDAGYAGDTLVMFISDNGMSFPFSKANCYLNSTKTPWIVRWPGHTTPGTVDTEHMISGIDFMPTILEAAGLPTVPGMDGRSFLPLLNGGTQDGRDKVFTEFHRALIAKTFPMRAVMTKRYGYIYNSWSNGSYAFQNEAQDGMTWDAMARSSDPTIAQRVQLYLYRVKHEFFDYQTDPNGLVNRFSDSAMQPIVGSLQNAMLTRMRQTGDPLLAEFEQYVPPTSGVKNFALYG